MVCVQVVSVVGLVIVCSGFHVVNEESYLHVVDQCDLRYPV